MNINIFYLSFYDLDLLPIKEIKQLCASNNITLKKYERKRKIIHKILQAGTNYFVKNISESNITSIIQKEKTPQHIFKYIFKYHQNLQELTENLINQKYILKYGKLEINEFMIQLEKFFNIWTTSSKEKKIIITCLLYQFFFENMTMLINDKKIKDVVLKKIEEFKIEEPIFQNVKWKLLIKKFVENHTTIISKILIKKNIPMDIQKNEILPFLDLQLT